MDCCLPGFPVHHQLLEPTQTHVSVALAHNLLEDPPTAAVRRSPWAKNWPFTPDLPVPAAQVPVALGMLGAPGKWTRDSKELGNGGGDSTFCPGMCPSS